MTYSQIIQVLTVGDRAAVAEQMENYCAKWPARLDAGRDVARRVTELLCGGHPSEDWRMIPPLKPAALLGPDGSLNALVWAVATEVRAAQLVEAGARMLAAGCLICPACGADGAGADSSSPAFYYMETMDSRRACGVVLHGKGKREVHVSDNYQDDYEGGHDDRVCCEACGWEFELPEGVSFEHGVSSTEIDAEIDAHQGAKPAKRARKAGAR